MSYRSLVLLWVVLIFPTALHADEPAAMRPLMVQGNWEIALQYDVTAKGPKIEDRSDDRNEMIRITRNAILVFRGNVEKKDQACDLKVIALADRGTGVLEFSMKNIGLPTIVMLYRFEGNRMLMCFRKDLDGRPKVFGEVGSSIVVFVPYQADRLARLGSRPKPEPKSSNVRFENVAPAPPAKIKDE